MYDDGLGVPRDAAAARRLWTRAAAKGHELAAKSLAGPITVEMRRSELAALAAGGHRALEVVPDGRGWKFT